MELTTASEAQSETAAGVAPAIAAESAPALPDSPARDTPWAVAFLLLIACVATAPGWLPGRVYVPTDCLNLYAPWGESAEPASRPGNELLLDQPTQFVPWTMYAAERLRHLELPLWNPYAGLGEPLLANGQSAVFYPAMVLHALLPPAWSWTLSAALRLWLAGCGTWFLAGRYGLRGVPRLLSAVAFMLCGFNVVWLNHPHVNTMALLPWGVLVIHRLLDRPSLGRIITGSLLFTVALFGGHPASCIHFVLTCMLVYAAHLFWIDPGRALRALPATAVTLALGFALAGIQWLPLMDYVAHSAAAAQRETLVQGQSAWAMRPTFLIGILFPYANGYPPDRVSPLEFALATHLPNTSEIAAAWVGTIPLLLAALGAYFSRRKKPVVLWLLVGGVAAAIAIQVPGISQIVRHIPGLSVSQNGRLLVTAALALAILAGFGFDALMERMRGGIDLPRLSAALRQIAITLAVLAIVGGVVLLAFRGPMVRHMQRTVERQNANRISDRQDYHPITFYFEWVRRFHTELVVTSLRLLIPAGMLAAAWALLARRRRNPNNPAALSPWPWFALALIDLLAFAIPYNTGAPRSTFYPTPPSIAWLQQQRDANLDAPFRVGATYHTFHPEISIAYHLSDVRGYDAITPRRYWDWMQKIDRLNSGEPAEVKQLFHSDMKALRLLSMRYLLATDGLTTAPAGNWHQVFPAVTPPTNAAATPATNAAAAAATTPGTIPGTSPSANPAAPTAANGHTIVYEDPEALPRAWVATLAQPMTRTLAWWAVPHGWMAAHGPGLLQKVAKFDFDPHELVLLDREIPPDDFEWMTRPRSPIQGAHPPPPDPSEFFQNRGRAGFARRGAAGRPKITWTEDSPERIRLHVENNRGGWLVLADTYIEGWTAKLGNPSWGRGREIDRLVVPAYGVLRAIPLTENDGTSVDVTFDYDPPAFRRGMLLSAGAASGIVLLFACWLIGVSRGSIANRKLPIANPQG